MQMFDCGLIDALDKKFVSRGHFTLAIDQNIEIIPYQFKHIAGQIIILAMGLGLSLLAFLGEICWIKKTIPVEMYPMSAY